MNFEYGTSLAVFQDSLVRKLQQDEPATYDEIRRLKDNMWITMASALAPSNLVIRQWALIDLFESNKDHEQSILEQMGKICENYMYKEGYSYFYYTQIVLDFYVRALDSVEIKNLVTKIEFVFSRSAYIGPDGATRWPAPYGDLRQIPLKPHLQGMVKPDDNFSTGFLTKKDHYYYIKHRYLGMNTHTSKESTLQIINGVPYYLNGKEFNWYTGYDKKYPSKTREILDTFSPKRVFSLFRRNR